MFFELHSQLPREGPGDDETTKRALAALGALPPCPEILDVGCGPGAQTLVLARETRGRVTAVDLHQPFLDELCARAKAMGLEGAVTAVHASMTNLPFAADSFDLIWSEGAIFIMGFGAGLTAWRPLLRNDGAMVISELTWLTDSPPEPARAFWAGGYPGMQTLAENRAAIERAGYTRIAEITLSHESWFTEYLTPLECRIDALASQRPHDAALQDFLGAERAEIEVARRYQDAFGYVFYLMRK